MIPPHLVGSMAALSPVEAIAAIRRRLADGGEAGDLATSDVAALLTALDDAERVARGLRWALAMRERQWPKQQQKREEGQTVGQLQKAAAPAPLARAPPGRLSVRGRLQGAAMAGQTAACSHAANDRRPSWPPATGQKTTR